MIQEPRVIADSLSWTLLEKPHGLPSAPLKIDETLNLTSWFLDRFPEGRNVKGYKDIEFGLVHRLDTATTGLVLFAKTQSSFDFFKQQQERDQINKTYHALSTRLSDAFASPWTEISQFRSWGPGRKEVRPVYRGMKGWIDGGKEYRTEIRAIEPVDFPSYDYNSSGTTVLIECNITKGFRHQIRSHLSMRGYPIIGDRLYHPGWKGVPESEDSPLQLFATGIRFIDPDSMKQAVFSLQPPDKRNR